MAAKYLYCPECKIKTLHRWINGKWVCTVPHVDRLLVSVGLLLVTIGLNTLWFSYLETCH
jgi:hypothetical protein